MPMHLTIIQEPEEFVAHMLVLPLQNEQYLD